MKINHLRKFPGLQYLISLLKTFCKVFVPKLLLEDAEYRFSRIFQITINLFRLYFDHCQIKKLISDNTPCKDKCK